jgi:GNAT superfamily N-acetyltransferase
VTTLPTPFAAPTRAATLREIAEDPDHHLKRVPASTRRIVTPHFTIILSPSPTQSVTSHVRLSLGELDAVIAEARRHVRDAGYVRNIWQLGPSAPAGLGQHLLERGFVRSTRPPFEPRATAMVMSERPVIAKASPGVEARLVSNIDEYRTAIEIAMAAFNESPEDAAGWMKAIPELWASHDGIHMYTHLAFLDGRPVGFGFATVANGGVLLGGSGVLEEARGHGVYRALVAARWEEAARLGHLGLVIHAGSMSKPILERCGFQAVGEIESFDDGTFL